MRGPPLAGLFRFSDPNSASGSFSKTIGVTRSPGPGCRGWCRLRRNPLVANIIAPPLVFLVHFRVPFDMPVGWRRQRIAAYLTNIALIALGGGIGLAVGFGRLAEIQLPIIALASITGAWLFTVQHRSDHTVWAREDDRDAVSALLVGSTYLHLPRLL